MSALPKPQILRFTEKAIHLARRAVSRYSSKLSKHRYTLPQHVVCGDEVVYHFGNAGDDNFVAFHLFVQSESGSPDGYSVGISSSGA